MKTLIDLSRFRKQLITVIVDLLFLPSTLLLAIWLRYDVLNADLINRYLWLLILVPCISIPIFIKIGLYRAVIRFINQKIIYAAVIGVSVSVLVSMAIVALTNHMIGMSRGVFGIYWIAAIAYMVASRFAARGYLWRVADSRDAKRVAIYGAGQAGVQLVRALQISGDHIPVAFIDDKRELRGANIAGLKVFSSEELPTLITKKRITEILLAMPSLAKAQQRRILDQLEPYKLKTRVTPPLGKLVNGELRMQDVRDIEVEDLLGRDPVQPNLKLISTCITNKTVLVTGAGGSIGSELCRQIVRMKPIRLLLLEMSEFALYSIEQELTALKHDMGLEIEIIPFLGSVLDQEKCGKVLTSFAVETIYHAAAYKHVPLVEHNPIEGIRNNAFGTLSIARAAIAAGVGTFVLISTDKAVRPTNVMGSTKRLAELILQAFAKEQSATRFCMVRFGNVLGSSGSVVPLFRKQIMEGGPITITHPEITRYFMTIPEAAQLVLQAGAMGSGGDVFVLDMGEPVKIVDLAKRMVHLSGLEVKSEMTSNGTIEIKHVGLRPGEKLYEELLIGKDVEGTEHPLIMRAQEVELPWSVLQEILARLEEACESFDYGTIRILLLQAVAEYSPQCDIQDLVWQKEKRNKTRIDDLLVNQTGPFMMSQSSSAAPKEQIIR